VPRLPVRDGDLAAVVWDDRSSLRLVAHARVRAARRTTYWVAYRLDFESRERIVAVENKFDRLTVRNGVLEPGPDPFARYAPYERTLRASKRHAFVFLKEFQPPRSYVAQLLAHGYTPHDVQTFVVYALPR
jgi:hypothetical protein